MVDIEVHRLEDVMVASGDLYQLWERKVKRDGERFHTDYGADLKHPNICG